MRSGRRNACEGISSNSLIQEGIVTDLLFPAANGTNGAKMYGYVRKIESEAVAPPGALIRKYGSSRIMLWFGSAHSRLSTILRTVGSCV